MAEHTYTRWLRKGYGTVSKASKVEAAFDRVYVTEEWGAGQGSGIGSDPRSAEPYIRLVEQFLQEREVASVLDCGCGDMRIANSIRWGSASYLGIEASGKALELAQRLNTKLPFMKDTIASTARRYDLALVKEVFQHLSFSDIRDALKALQGCRYVLTVNDIPGSTRDIPTGGYRPVDLRDPPVSAAAEVLLTYSVGSETKQVLLITNF